jgi:hypothetical protein
MTSDQVELLRKRKDDFDSFYKSLLPALVEFVGLLGWFGVKSKIASD